MRCTACGAVLTPDELLWQTALCDRCALAPAALTTARDALQRALATYYASVGYISEYATLAARDGDALALWAPETRP